MKNKIPKLRFKEFSGEWEENKLTNIADFQEGPGILANDFRESGVPLIRLSGLTGSFVSTIGCNYLDRDKVEQKWKHFRLKTGDILVTTSGTLGNISEVVTSTENAIAYTGIIRFRPKGRFDRKYLKYLLTSSEFEKQSAKMSTGAVLHHFGPSHLRQMKFSTPIIEEQEKIAGFLSEVDAKIEKLQKKKELLEKYKKGVMQKIFSQQVRFKDENGKDYPDWQEKKLDEVLVKNSNKNKGALHKLVQSVSNVSGFINQTSLFKDHVIASKDLSNYYVITKGTFAYNPSRINVGSLAYKDDNQTSIVSPLYVSFNAKNTEIYDIYLLNWFDTGDFKRQMQNSFEGSVRNTLSYDSLKKMKILIPAVHEQQKIAEFLTSIDDKIDLEKNKLKQAKQFKKALLQRMFV